MPDADRPWQYVSAADWLERLDQFAAKAAIDQGLATSRTIAAANAADGRAQVADVTEGAFDQLNRLVAQSPMRERWACAKGCSWCCHQYVSVSAPEAIALADAVREAFPPEWLDHLRGMLAERSARIATLFPDGTYHDARLPCVFLTAEGACGIHAWRPLMCRGYLSIDVVGCQDIYQGKPAAKPPFDRFAHRAGNAVLAGVRAGSASHDRDDGAFELHGALLRALETPDAAERWRRGERVFVGCRALG